MLEQARTSAPTAAHGTLNIMAKMRPTWFEEYRCRCVSGYELRRKDLLGYCPTHGADRVRVHRVPTTPEERTKDRHRNTSPKSTP